MDQANFNCQINSIKERSKILNDLNSDTTGNLVSCDTQDKFDVDSLVELETEIPEPLFEGIETFIKQNPSWNKYEIMNSALANFLFQNGCDERAVTEKYLDDIFSLQDH